jgi:hypothetical protein
MISTNLQGVADLVVRRAQRQGYVLAREVREELVLAGLCETLWKDVLALARPSLCRRGGRYHFAPPLSPRLRQEQEQQKNVRRAVLDLLRRAADRTEGVERRAAERVEFVQSVQVIGEDGQSCTLLSRDLSPTGIRLVGTRRLLGQKVRVLAPRPGGPPWCFLVRVLWTCAVGDGLFENGGAFLDVEEGPPPFDDALSPS